MITTPVDVMDEHIVAFMKGQTVMTIATCRDNLPHCATCFYVFVPGQNIIVFKSKPSTDHITQA